jgi:pimeloyl-ACP methyl ester carboxylesterase
MMTMEHTHTTDRDRLLEGLPLQQRQRQLAGIATAVLEGGDGPPLVLLHGGIQAGGVIWWRVLPRLASTHRVVVPDLPGLGESAPAARLDTWTVAVWLEALIQATCHEPPILVAHSAPGALAARFAVQDGAGLRRLVLVDAAGLAPFRPSPGLLVALGRSVLRPGIGSFEGLMGRVMYDLDRVRQPDGERWQALAGYAVSRATRPSAKRAMRQVARGGTRAIPHQQLRGIAVPTVLLWGSRDPLLPLPIAQMASARFGWPLHVIDDAGHLPHVEQPKAFLDALAAATAEQ